jgi:methionine-rich copper-binding protein CopC
MSHLRPTAKCLLICLTILAMRAALAHPALLSSTPEENAEVVNTERIELHFSEKLVTQFSGASLVMTGMPEMPGHAPMKMQIKVSGTDDPKTMVITPTKPLPAGTYRIDWRAVASDTHPVTGSIHFSVK